MLCARHTLAGCLSHRNALPKRLKCCNMRSMMSPESPRAMMTGFGLATSRCVHQLSLCTAHCSSTHPCCGPAAGCTTCYSVCSSTHASTTVPLCSRTVPTMTMATEEEEVIRMCGSQRQCLCVLHLRAKLRPSVRAPGMHVGRNRGPCIYKVHTIHTHCDTTVWSLMLCY